MAKIKRYQHNSSMKDPLLNQLRQQLRAAQPVPAPKPAVTTKAAAPEEDVDDATLFARATRGVSRIETSDTAPAVSSERKKRLDHNMLYRRAVATAEEDVNAPLSDTAALLRPVQAETPPAMPAMASHSGYCKSCDKASPYGRPPLIFTAVTVRAPEKPFFNY